MSEENTELDVIDQPLNDRELQALHRFRSSQQAPLAPDTQAKLFKLFLNGKTTSEIQRLNPQFTFGQIVNARVMGEWDRRFNEHLDELLNNTASRVRQVTMESINFVCDLLSVTHQMHSDRIKKFLQTGDPSELGTLQINSLQGYKQGVELLQKLTGQDKQQNVKVDGTITHKAEAPSHANQPSPEEAANILQLLASASKKD